MKPSLSLVWVKWVALVCAAACLSDAASAQVWTGAWAAAPVLAPKTASEALAANGSVYRDVVHLSLGGGALRLVVSNEFGTMPLRVASVHVARSVGGGLTDATTDKAALFGGVEAVTIPAGAAAVSDAVAMPVRAFDDLAVTLVVPAQSDAVLTWHELASSTNVVAPMGDDPATVRLAGAKSTKSWYLLKDVEVDAGPEAGAVVTLGASITDGYHSTLDANARWPDVLAQRLHANAATAKLGVLNEGISGARLLHDGRGQSALARLDRDVLAQPGAKYVIVALGTNDIGRTFFPEHPGEGVTADEMIWSLQQIAQRAHARGMKVIFATLGPFEGAGYYSADGETMRQAFNAFVRRNNVADGVIDFDKAVRDPAHATRMLPTLDSGDHLHPNDAGYKLMGEAIDLKLFAKQPK